MTATAGLRRRLATMAVIMDIKTNRKGGRAGRPKFGFLHIFSHIYLQFPVDFYVLFVAFFIFVPLSCSFTLLFWFPCNVNFSAPCFFPIHQDSRFLYP